MAMLNRLRQFARGFLKVHYGSCGGDPIAWEQDLLRRREEEAAGRAPDDTNERAPVAEGHQVPNRPMTRELS